MLGLRLSKGFAYANLVLESHNPSLGILDFRNPRMEISICPGAPPLYFKNLYTQVSICSNFQFH